MNDKLKDGLEANQALSRAAPSTDTLAVKVQELVKAVQGEPANALEYAQKSYKEIFDQISHDDKVIRRTNSVRFVLALILKGLAIFGGAIIGSGVVSEEVARILGGTIVAGTLLDLWLSNHSQLMTLEAAHGTYGSLIDRVKAEHRLGLLTEVMPLGTGVEAARSLVGLCTRLVQVMESTRRDVRDAIRKKRYQYLNSLALENRAKTPSE